jgi:serine/threonine-protein kinase HipA
MTNELVALLDGNEVGRVRNDARGRLTFVYDSVGAALTSARA